VKIALTGLTATGFHGVLPQERRDGQLFSVDVELSLPTPVSDDLDATVNYAAVAANAVAIITGEPVNLIETLAVRIADDLLATWSALRAVTVTVHKPQAPIGQTFSDVSCTVQASSFVLSLGANLSDTIATLRGAVDALADTPGITVTDISSVYRTTPVEVNGDPQPDYHNLVVVGSTTLRPMELLARTSAIEVLFGRQRLHHHAPRTLDIDLIDVGDVDVNTPTLTLPHPRAFARAFVLVPWLEIVPNARLPMGRLSDLVTRVDTSGIVVLGPLSQ